MNMTRSAIPAIFILTVAVIASMNSGRKAPVQPEVVKLERVVVVGKRTGTPATVAVSADTAPAAVMLQADRRGVRL